MNTDSNMAWKGISKNIVLENSYPLLFCLLFTQHNVSFAQERVTNQLVRPNEPELYDVLIEHSSSIEEPTVVGKTKVADPDKWQSTFFIKDYAGKLLCTATLVGPVTLITAAHCVADEGGLNLNMKIPIRIKLTCRRHNGYKEEKRNYLNDVAICVSDVEIETNRFPYINTSPAAVKKGDEIIFAGFGCTVRGGENPLASSGVLNVSTHPYPEVVDVENGIMVVGRSAACSGDSGGIAYKLDSSRPTKRSVVGVVSRSDEDEKTKIQSLSSEGIKEFITSFNTKICGFGLADSRCYLHSPDDM